MAALAAVADLKSDVIFSYLAVVLAAYEKGSVITVDNAVSVFAKTARADERYYKELFRSSKNISSPAGRKRCPSTPSGPLSA